MPAALPLVVESLTFGRLQVPGPLTHPSKTPQDPLQVALKQLTMVRYTIFPYAFKSHSWWQTRDIPRRHSKTGRSRGPLVSQRYVPDHAPPSASETNMLATGHRGAVTRQRLRCFLLHNINKPPYPPSWYPNKPLRPLRNPYKTLESLTPYGVTP